METLALVNSGVLLAGFSWLVRKSYWAESVRRRRPLLSCDSSESFVELLFKMCQSVTIRKMELPPQFFTFGDHASLNNKS